LFFLSVVILYYVGPAVKLESLQPVLTSRATQHSQLQLLLIAAPVITDPRSLALGD